MERELTALVLRTLDLRDIEDVLAIQAASPEIAQWSLWDYDRVARGEMAGWVAESKNGEITGFIVARPIASDLEILNFAVRPTARRQGIGAALLDEALRWGSAFSAGQAFLEVRASNLAALRFYEQHKFQVTGRRPRYYTAPIEDALVLSAQLS
ncbi:MAG: ribosomal protein S18-alanine N-acetyltransferase [Candidatus Acidiferrales bacterium]